MNDMFPGRGLRSPYTIVTGRIRSVCLRIRSYLTVYRRVVYGEIRPYTVKYGDRIRAQCTGIVNDRFLSPYFAVFLRIRS